MLNVDFDISKKSNWHGTWRPLPAAKANQIKAQHFDLPVYRWLGSRGRYLDWRPPRSVTMIALIQLLRIRQWVKNGFVLAPMFFSSEMSHSTAALRGVGAFVV